MSEIKSIAEQEAKTANEKLTKLKDSSALQISKECVIITLFLLSVN